MTRNVEKSEVHHRHLAYEPSSRCAAKTTAYGGAGLKAETVEERWKEF